MRTRTGFARGGEEIAHEMQSMPDSGARLARHATFRRAGEVKTASLPKQGGVLELAQVRGKDKYQSGMERCNARCLIQGLGFRV